MIKMNYEEMMSIKMELSLRNNSNNLGNCSCASLIPIRILSELSCLLPPFYDLVYNSDVLNENDICQKVHMKKKKFRK